MKQSRSTADDDIPPSRQIDSIISGTEGWRGKKLELLRSIVLAADNTIYEEVKWKKPSKPEGVAVWSSDGIVCVADVLKNAVRLTFPRGASIEDRSHVFNTRLDSSKVRAVDFHDGEAVNEDALKEIVVCAVELNRTRSKK